MKVFVIEGHEVETLFIGKRNYRDTGCPEVPRVPYNAAGLVAGAILDGKPTICGSWAVTVQSCYQYNTVQGTWNSFGDLVLPSYFSQSLLFNGDEWWLLGYGFVGTRNTTLVISDREILPGPEFPNIAALQCAVKINETHVFISGGILEERDELGKNIVVRDTFILDWTVKSWTRLPDLPEGLYFHDVKQ